MINLLFREGSGQNLVNNCKIISFWLQATLHSGAGPNS